MGLRMRAPELLEKEADLGMVGIKKGKDWGDERAGHDWKSRDAKIARVLGPP